MNAGKAIKVSIVACAAFLIIFAVFGVHAAHAVSMSFPTTGNGGTPVNGSSTPGTIINSFYQFALFLSGIIAFGAIVFGGIKYMTSAGNPSAQSEGKEWIYAALLGVALLAGAYLVLNTVNPQLTSLSLPTLPVSYIPSQPNTTFNTAQCGGSSCTGLCLNDTSGQPYCQPFNTSSTNSNPACQGMPAGCAVYTPVSPAPSGCSSNLFALPCIASPPPAIASCFTAIQC